MIGGSPGSKYTFVYLVSANASKNDTFNIGFIAISLYYSIVLQ